LPKNPTVAEVVAHVNANVEKIEGWRADGVKIRASSAPMTLSGSMVVQRDRRLRLEVTSPLGKEVDFGSNDDVFWLWSKRAHAPNEPAPLIFAAHDDMDVARQRLPMPFEPQWLMEALGVAPLSADGVRMEGEPGVYEIRLVSQHQMPDGPAIRKVVKVHGCHGYVMEHSVYDARGKPLVRAVMTDYRIDAQTGAALPRHVKVDWPQAEMSLAMEFGPIEVNPPSIPEAVWQMPDMPHTPVIDLAAGRHRPRQRPSAAVLSRADLSTPDRVVPTSTEESFELPQIGRSRDVVELEGIDFEPPVTPDFTGRARFDAAGEE
jgi:hypothetical protein